MEGRTATVKLDPMAEVRTHLALATLTRVGSDLIGIGDETGLRNPRIREEAFKKAARMLEANPNLSHKTLSKAAFYLALEDIDEEKSKDNAVMGKIAKSVDRNEAWRVLVPTMRRELAKAYC